MKVSMLAKSAAVALAFGLVTSTPAHAVDLSGSGASFPALLIEACKAPFATASGHSFTYASSGSGAGRTNSDRSVGDFWFSDAAHTAATKRASIIHAPVVAAPIGILHNLPSRNTLSLSASTIAGIFSGAITRWNDPAIVRDNNRAYDKIVYKTKNGAVVKDSKGDPIVAKKIATTTRYTLPDKPIKVVYRSDSSGTTENFTNYLNKSAPTVWTKAKAAVFTTSFPGNINSPENLGRIVGAASSTGVSQLAGKTPYSITFAEVNYAVANRLKVANVINPAGNAVEPTSVTTSAFLSQATIDANGIMSFDYATKEAGAYTLGIVSYMLVDTNYPDKNKAAAVKSLASFILSPACAKDKGEALGFSVLDGEFLKKAQSLVAKIG
ncbi:substrate-binding domain-containing protein [Candidatus Planktophila lacus]|jgi:phosphate transport system substrate-binding protein|uniref:Phosphate-binding protein n=1 Tax=Candidatus Planktophila lacus TaxID=1884913 RepID=A0AAC9YQ21_9ACTN|nr:substrate-binding domain-containing protein [Candidatus Planktophila lacus]ASY10285.1 phosphate transport system substrate-binding protein [Candidatus Planktophila lacus]